MAINPKKLLPPSKTGEIVKSLGSNLTTVSKNIRTSAIQFPDVEKSSETFSEETQKNVSLIRVKVIKIEDILKGTIAAEKKALDDKKREESTKRREKEEEKLEKQSKKETGGIKVPSIPRMGFFDRIKNFITNVILGYFAVRLIDHLPKIIPVLKFLGQATDFVLNYGGKLLDGLVTFIDWGYKAQDKTKGFLKDLGGENFVKVFDAFNGAIGTLIDTAIIAAIVVSTQGKDGILDVGMDMLTNRFAGKGAQQAAQSGARTAGQAGLRALPPAGGTAAATAVGKQGTKSILKTVKPLLKRLPIIGALIDFGLSVALGESPGRAAFKAIGAGLLGSVGAAIGSVVPIAGNIVGGIVGGMAGDAVGGALYDMFFSNKKPQQKPQKIQKKAGGGITRGGETLGSVKREIGGTKKKGKYKRTVPKKPGKVEINEGADVGGKEKILGIFPKPSLPDVVNPFKVVKTAGEDLGKTDYFGPILAITSKITLGQKPTPQDYQNVGLGINMLISKGVQDGQLKGGIVAAFAEGGLVDPDVLSAVETGGDISNWVAKTFKGEIESNAQKTLRLIRENAQKKKLETTSPSTAPSADDMGLGAGVQVSSDSEDFWLLATAAMFENSNPQGAADVAQVIYNRTQYPAWNAPTIRKAILNPNQFQPVRQYGGTAAWGAIKTKQDALRFAKSHGKTQEQLERVAAALLDKSKQSDARSFVGPRDSFRAESYEKANNHLANETEKTRHGHTFGFEPGGAMIGQFKAGKLSAAQVNAGVTGNVNLKGGDGKFIQGNSGRSEGTHFHIGTTKPGDKSGVAAAGFRTIKHFLGKKSIYVGRSGETIPANATDEQIRGYIARGQASHRQTELDLQIGGTGAGNKVAFPLALKGMKYSDTDGYGVSADVVGVNAFVGHGRYKPDGTLAPQQRLVLNAGAPDFYAFHGKNFGIVPFDGFTLRLHKGEVFKVIDKDSVGLLGYDLTKEIIDIENQSQLVAKAPSIIEKLKTISGYASYEEGSPETIIIPTPVPSTQDDYQAPTPSSGGMMISLGGSIDPYETLYAGG